MKKSVFGIFFVMFLIGMIGFVVAVENRTCTYVGDKFCRDNTLIDCPGSCAGGANASCSFWESPTVCTNGCSNGVCITNTTPCIAEGSSYGTYVSPTVSGVRCCSGLTPVSVSQLGQNGICITQTDSAMCTKCGNGICGLGENKCNCPSDCNTNNSKFCSDIDGKNYFVKASITWDYGDGVTHTDIDNCYNNWDASGNSWIFEKFCDGKDFRISSIPCPNNAKCLNDGACASNISTEVCGDGICTANEKLVICPSCPIGQPCTEGCHMACSKDCENCYNVCKHVGSKSEGWYDSCTGQLIQYANCGTSTNNTQCSRDSDCPQIDCFASPCPSYKCEDGRCVLENEEPECYSDSDCPQPTCGIGVIEGSNVSTTCVGQINRCINGECKMGSSESITEKITCKFENTKKDQSCYLAGQWGPEDEGTKFCDAEDGSSCVITYLSYKGEAVTWKSTCGGYQYTTQDGNDEVIYFKCSEGETNISQIGNKGFMYSYYQCYDGIEGKQGSESSCKPSDVWHKYAKEACEGHCTTVGQGKCNGNEKCEQKCGVNTFSVSGECYLEGPSCSILNCANSYYDYESNQCRCGIESPKCKNDYDCPQPACGINMTCPKSKCINGQCKIEEEILVCKDSCPFVGKCYPITYRQGGKYCSVSGSFEPQLEGNAVCDNNFECQSNVCAGGKCVSQSLIEKIIAWFSRMFGG